MARRMGNDTLAEKVRRNPSIARSEIRWKLARAIENCEFNVSAAYYDNGKTFDTVNIPGVGPSGIRVLYEIFGGNNNGKEKVEKGRTEFEYAGRYGIKGDGRRRGSKSRRGGGHF